MEQFGKFRFGPILLAFQIWMYIVNSSLYCTALGIGLMWVQRRRHWSGIGPALYRVSRLMRFRGLMRFRLLGGPRDSVIFSGGSPSILHLPSPAFAPIVD